MKSISVMLALVAAGCATAPITMQSGTPAPPARIHQAELTVPGPGRTAKVSFLRDSGALGAACAHKVSVDGRAVFSLRSGEYQTLYLTPGQHTFALEVEGAACPKLSASRSAVLGASGEEIYRIASTSGPRVVIIDTRGSDLRASSSEPPFKWDSDYSEPGVSLTLKEKGRHASSAGIAVEYELTASGFSGKAPPTLWWKRGTSISKLPATLDQDGTVSVLGLKSLWVEGYVPGQPLDLALESSVTRAHAKTYPFPIVARQGDYWASVELLTETGLVFQIVFGGFQPEEKAQVTSQYKTERLTRTIQASAKGRVVFPVMFGPGDRGTADATATGRSGTVSVQYKVGRDALNPEPAR